MSIAEISRKHFPYDTPNPGQMESIIEIVEQFQKGITHVICQIPTGCGKSAIATTVHKVLKELNSKHRTCIVTASKSLQDQYVNEEPGIYNLMGKANYGCSHKAETSYNSPACKGIVRANGCTPKKECTYVKRRTFWCDIASLKLTNTSFIVEASDSLVTEPENKSDLIVIDECHEIDDFLIEHSKIKFELKDFSALENIGFEQTIGKIRHYIDTFSNMQIGTAFKPSFVQKEEMVKLRNHLDDIIAMLTEDLERDSCEFKEAKSNALDALNQIYSKTQGFGVSDNEEWILNNYIKSTMAELMPVYSEQVAHHGILRKANQFLHMSATICGFDGYRKSLGIKDSYHIIDVPNPIPVESRQLFVLARHKVSGGFTDWNGLTRTVDELIAHHKGENGIIHTVSFANAKEIIERSKFRSKMIATGDRFEIADHLNKLNSGHIVLSPSTEKGFDGKGDICRFQILVKVPYGFLGSPLIKLNSARHPEYYSRKAILRLVQACGRGVRGVDDFATNYIIDANFIRLYNQNRDIFPEWFRDSVNFVNE